MTREEITPILLRSKKWESHMLMIDAIAYEAMRRHEHKLKKQRTIVPLKNKRKEGKKQRKY